MHNAEVRLDIAVSIFMGALFGWLFAWMFMFTELKKACPAAEETQCKFFGNQKICLVGEK